MIEKRIAVIDRNLLDRISREAAEINRQRLNHNFHQPEDPVQRFLNAIEPGSYIRPHRHIEPLKDEVFLLLRGRGAVIIFDDGGGITAVHPLDITAGYWGIDIPGGLYHTILSLETQTVFYEIKPGPYNPQAAKHFAPWSPAEGSPEAAPYLSTLVEQVRPRQPIGRY